MRGADDSESHAGAGRPRAEAQRDLDVLDHASRPRARERIALSDPAPSRLDLRQRVPDAAARFPPKGVVEPSMRRGGPYGHRLLSAENRSPSSCQRGSRENSPKIPRKWDESRQENAIEGVAACVADRVAEQRAKRWVCGDRSACFFY
jgi:hypothetical protein